MKITPEDIVPALMPAPRTPVAAAPGAFVANTGSLFPGTGPAPACPGEALTREPSQYRVLKKIFVVPV